MQVSLRRKWFAPDGSLYEPSDNPHTFPDAWEKQLPSTAKVVEAELPPKPESKGKAKADDQE